MNFQNIKGGRELLAELQKLPAKIEANVMRAALRAGANVIKAEVLQRVPVGPTSLENMTLYGSYEGALRDSVRVRVRSKRGNIRVSVSAGSAKAWYWRFVEFGTKAHYIKPKSRKSLFLAGLAKEVVMHPGARAQPFMRPAYDARAASAVEAVRATVRAKLSSKRFTREWSTSAPAEDA